MTPAPARSCETIRACPFPERLEIAMIGFPPGDNAAPLIKSDLPAQRPGNDPAPDGVGTNLPAQVHFNCRIDGNHFWIPGDCIRGIDILLLY